MTQIIWTVLVLFIGGVLGVCLGPRYRGGVPVEATPAVVGRITELADLVVLRVPVSKVHVTRIGGYVGGMDCVVLVNGNLEVCTDLNLARFEEVNSDEHTARLVLTEPTTKRVWLDPEQSSIYRIDRKGLWKMVPFTDTTSGIVNQSMAEAQQCIESVGRETDLIIQAKLQAELVIHQFLEALGWEVQLVWVKQEADSK